MNPIKKVTKKIVWLAAAGLIFLLITFGCLLFVPPIRDQFFDTILALATGQRHYTRADR